MSLVQKGVLEPLAKFDWYSFKYISYVLCVYNCLTRLLDITV